MIVGIDEVGRGPWAGPLVVGAVILGGVEINGLTDSKKLTKKRREELDAIIRRDAAAYGLGWVEAHEIDTLGLALALQLACRRALDVVDTLGVAYHEIIIDGTVNLLQGTAKGHYVATMKKADLLVPSVSAASIIAKVARDAYMAKQDMIYEGYMFGSHVGYGTAVHRKAIEMRGITPLHRLSFAPLRKYQTDAVRRLNVTTTAPEQSGTAQPTNHMGSIAETETEHYLLRNGHTIIERNWKTKYCEIDIISQKDGTFYFTEVKYRKSSLHGDGFAAITRKKLNQMTFAAKLYAQTHSLHQTDMVLAVASLTGQEATVEDWLVLTEG